MCCVLTAVPEINKPANTPCQFLNILEPSCENCLIYKDRPQRCKDYKCAWLLGYGQEEDQPNKSGILIDGQEDILLVREGWVGAKDSPQGKKAIQRISAEIDREVTFIDFQNK